MGLLRRVALSPAIQVKRVISGNFGQTRYTRYLEAHQFDHPLELGEIQAEKLCSIMRHACERIPFYSHLKNDLGLVPETAFDDIKKFPVVTKHIISECPQDFVDHDVPVVMRMKTGGTSNVKVEVLRDRHSHNMRNDEYFNRMAGIYPGMRRLILSRHESNYRIGNDENPEDFIHYYHNMISGTFQVKPMPLTKEKLSRIYKYYMSGKPEFIRANLNTGYVFAKYVEDNGLSVPPVKVIRSSSTQMIGEYRDTLRRVFGAEPYDAYGASEINFVASQCKAHGGMHYIPMSHYIEVLRDNGEEADMGETGSMIVTSLVHKAMPIIRYRIGDYAAMSKEACPCGRTYPMIREILGRDIEVIKTAGGNIKGFDILDLLKSCEGIADCQVIERSSGGILLNIVKADGFKSGNEQVIFDYIIQRTGIDEIEVVYVPMIPILPNAKSLRVIPAHFDPDIEDKLLYFGGN